MKNTRSILQVFELEWKMVLWIAAFVILVPFIILVNSLHGFSLVEDMGILEQISLITGQSQLDTVDLSWLVTFAGILSIVVTPWIAYTIARKLEGDRLLFAIKKATKALKTKRFWNIVLKVNLPLVVLCNAVMFAFNYFFGISELINLLFTFSTSTLTLILVALIVSVLAVIFLAAVLYVLVANVVYFRGASRIKMAFKAIPTREFVKMLIVNIPYVILVIAACAISYYQLTNLSLLTLISGIIGAFKSLLVMLFIIDLLFAFVRVALVINSSSKVEIK